jgi:hypothetical protein
MGTESSGELDWLILVLHLEKPSVMKCGIAVF